MTVWNYPRCVVDEVHDGDTIKVDIDHGMQIWSREVNVRLTGIAARELREPGGVQARDHLRSLLPVGTSVAIRSSGWDKFGGRISGVVFHDGESVQVQMVEAGYAVAWDGKGAQPQPPWPLP